jgi:hypothetical protein
MIIPIDPQLVAGDDVLSLLRSQRDHHGDQVLGNSHAIGLFTVREATGNPPWDEEMRATIMQNWKHYRLSQAPSLADLSPRRVRLPLEKPENCFGEVSACVPSVPCFVIDRLLTRPKACGPLLHRSKTEPILVIRPLKFREDCPIRFRPETRIANH